MLALIPALIGMTRLVADWAPLSRAQRLHLRRYQFLGRRETVETKPPQQSERLIAPRRDNVRRPTSRRANAAQRAGRQNSGQIYAGSVTQI